IEILDLGNSEFPMHLPLKTVLSVPKDYPDLDFAHLYRSEIYLNRVEAPANAYQFNYAKYLSRKNIFHQAYAPNGFKIA
ncbi:DUF4131 domain-containing protein, partial [Acinetobacter baumannii]